jgi:hypothetical protein
VSGSCLLLAWLSDRGVPELPGKVVCVLQSFRVGGEPDASLMLASFRLAQSLRGLVRLFVFDSQAADRRFGLTDLLADYSQVHARSLVSNLRLSNGIAIGTTQEPSRLLRDVQIVTGTVEPGGRPIALGGDPGKVLLRLDKSLSQFVVPGCLWLQQSDLLHTVWSGAGVDQAAGLGQCRLEGLDVNRSAKGGTESFRSGRLAARASQGPGQNVVGAGRRVVLVFVAWRFADHTGQVVLAASGHAHVQVLATGRLVDHHDALIYGETLALMNSDRIGQGDVVSGVVGGHIDLSPAVEGCEQQGVVGMAGQYLPAVPVSNPAAVGRDEAAVVVGGDHFVADADDLVAYRDAVGFDLAGGDAGGPGSQSELVDGVMIGGHDDHRPAFPSCLKPRLVNGVDHDVTITGADPTPVLVLGQN